MCIQTLTSVITYVDHIYIIYTCIYNSQYFYRTKKQILLSNYPDYAENNSITRFLRNETIKIVICQVHVPYYMYGQFSKFQKSI
jgi:hypothetical protein